MCPLKLKINSWGCIFDSSDMEHFQHCNKCYWTICCDREFLLKNFYSGLGKGVWWISENGLPKGSENGNIFEV